jgi:ElaA protein
VDVTFVRFDDFTPHDLYALLRLRSAVFVVEQNCVYLDPDDRDQSAVHALGREHGRLVACARWYDDGELHLGRIVTAPTVRGRGLGHALVSACLGEIGPAARVVMSAQAHLEGFYASHGFVAEGAGYLEDGIPHVRMVRARR